MIKTKLFYFGDKILGCMLNAYISLLLYTHILLKCPYNITYSTAKLLLIGSVIFSIIFCTLFLNRNLRNRYSDAAMVIIPIGIFSVVTYWSVASKWMIIILSISVVISIALSAYLLSHKINFHKFLRCNINIRKYIRNVMLHRLHECCVLFQTVIAGGLLAIIILISFQRVFSGNTISSSISTLHTDQTIAQNIETLSLFSAESWKNLTIQEKIDVLQTAANIEASYLGLPNELNIGASDLNDGVVACYCDNNHVISMDINYLETLSGFECLRALCHEAYHSYQYRLVDAYNCADDDLKSLKAYKATIKYAEEFNAYTDANAGYDSYYNQYCESDARDYADESVAYYYCKICAYLGDIVN